MIFNGKIIDCPILKKMLSMNIRSIKNIKELCQIKFLTNKERSENSLPLYNYSQENLGVKKDNIINQELSADWMPSSIMQPLSDKYIGEHNELKAGNLSILSSSEDLLK